MSKYPVTLKIYARQSKKLVHDHLFPSPNTSCSSHSLHIFQTSWSPYYRVGQAKCNMGIMSIPEVAFRSKGLETSSWGSSESGTNTLECIESHLIGWKLNRDVTLCNLWKGMGSRIELSHKNSIIVQWLAVRIQWKEYATNCEGEAPHGDLDFTVTEKYF